MNAAENIEDLFDEENGDITCTGCMRDFNPYAVEDEAADPAPVVVREGDDEDEGDLEVVR